jgi:predicted Fe-S protein YdhL (DUF1289 family)
VPGSDLCEGCFRTLDEIAEWGAASDQRRREILAALAGRRPQQSEPGLNLRPAAAPHRGS